MPSTDNRDGWVTVADAARFLGITPQGLRLSYVAELPPDAVDKTVRPMLVNPSAILAIYVARQLGERLAPDANDPLLSGIADSPALERYRAARADLAEIEVCERRQDVLSRSAVRDVLARWASHLRRAGDRIARIDKPSAEILRDALAECDEIAKQFGEQLQNENAEQ